MSASHAASPPATRRMAFGDLEITYDDRVLTPRPWTRLQSEWAAELAVATPGPLLELCTGAGHIGLLAAHLSGRGLVAVDVDPVACDLARANAVAACLADVVDVRQADLRSALAPGERFGVVVADPPWVPTTGCARFPEDPLLAIDGGGDGLDLARVCLSVAADHLADDGDLLLQVGDDLQADVLLTTPEGEGWDDAGRRRHPRGVVLRLRRAVR